MAADPAADPTRVGVKADELYEHLRALAEPNQVYSGLLPLFPEVYLLEVTFPGVATPGGKPVEAIRWVSPAPRPRADQPDAAAGTWVNRLPPYSPPNTPARITCEYRVHTFNKFQRDRAETRNGLLAALGLLAGGTGVAVVVIARFLRRERRRELARWEAVATAEHQQRELLHARVLQQDAERELLETRVRRQAAEQAAEELRRQLLENELAAAKLSTRAAEAERSALELKSQVYASIGVMAGSYAHNIKNLLVRPNDLLNRCMEGDGLATDQRGMLTEVKSTLGMVTDRLQQILKTVRRDPSRAEAARLDLVALAADAGRTWEAVARDKWKIRLTVHPPPAGSLFVLGDESHLQQAVENLLFNARDAVFEKRDQVRDEARRHPEADRDGRQKKILAANAWRGEIEIRTTADGDGAVLEVADNGIGMSEEVRRNCLTTHFSTKRGKAISEAHAAGMGLGLSFVAVVLEHHGATLDIVSEPSRGTTFRVRLPLAVTAE